MVLFVYSTVKQRRVQGRSTEQRLQFYLYIIVVITHQNICKMMCMKQMCAAEVLHFSLISRRLCGITELLLSVLLSLVCFCLTGRPNPLIKQACLEKWPELRPNEGPDKAYVCVCVYVCKDGRF